MTDSSPLPNENEFDDELKNALAAAFGDDAMSMMVDETIDGMSAFSQSDQGDDESSPLIQFAKELNHAIYFDDRSQSCDIDSGETLQKQDSDCRFVVFSVDRQRFGLPLTSVVEIARCSNVTKLPRTPAWLRGVCNLRGQIISVTDLRCLFQFVSDSTVFGEKIIVVRSDEYSATTAIVIDSVLGIRDPGEMRGDVAGLKHVIGKNSSGTATIDGIETVLIDPDKLFGSAELFSFNQ